MRATALKSDRVIIVGAGMGGLAAAFELAAAGFDVTVLERAEHIGGKIRQIGVGDKLIDAGPTVLTMRWVFERLLGEFGFELSNELCLHDAPLIARHAWGDDGHLALFADRTRSADAIGTFCGAAQARAYLSFAETARQLYEALRPTFIEASQPSMVGLAGRMARVDPKSLILISPGTSLWQVLTKTFQDARLRQLFGRYATYCGSSPYSAQATLMLVAHVEQEGVWTVDGGMHALAAMLSRLAERQGATIRTGAKVARISTDLGRVSGVVLEDGEALEADAVILNADAAAVASGLLGDAIIGAAAKVPARMRSLSALAFTVDAEFSGFPLTHHNVFFSSDYRAEFEDILTHKRLPQEPTVYLCAQDRRGSDADCSPQQGSERALILVNAPANGDTHTFAEAEIKKCWEQTRTVMRRCGLDVASDTLKLEATSPSDFHQLFPGTGGALYGRNSHGWAAAFQRPGNRTRIPGLYMAGGSVHPGPGVPMAALSGRQAAASLKADRASTRRFRLAGTSGGTSMR